MDLGGIINHTEQLIGGLQDLGHTVHLKEFTFSVRTHDQRKGGCDYIGPSGIPSHQGKGWEFPREARVPYKGAPALNSAKQILNNYDLVIWTTPVPSKNKLNLGNYYWPELYDIKPKQIAFIHDGNCKQGIPHILEIQDKLTGLACVHACALNGSDHLKVPRSLIVNPQLAPVREYTSWEDKFPGFVSMQTFKAWKHVHDLIGAIRFMPSKTYCEFREVIGKGIEYQYMTSEEKCKPQYFHDDGERYWEMALNNGMVHRDYMTPTNITELLCVSRVLVDPSWSRKYARIGGHWNRVVVDAMIQGAIPVARRMGMGDELFHAGYHYVEVPQEATPEEYADIVYRAGRMSSEEAAKYQKNARAILPMFERGKVAMQVIALSHGEYQIIDTCKPDPKVQSKYEDTMFNHFGRIASC
jgi:hypothetical protein